MNSTNAMNSSNPSNSMNPSNLINSSNTTSPRNHKSILFRNNRRAKTPVDRNNPKHKPQAEEEVFKKALDDMYKGLNRFGPKEILNLMVIHSHRDEVVHRLPAQFPTVVAVGDFLHTLPVCRVNKGTFRRLKRSGCIV